MLQLQEPVVVTCMYGTLGNIPKEEDRISALINMKNNSVGGKILLGVFNMNELEKARSYYKKLSKKLGRIVEVLDIGKEKTYFFFPKAKFFQLGLLKRE